jgi:predicted DNA-binding transcriptional regulator AlpA
MTNSAKPHAPRYLPAKQVLKRYSIHEMTLFRWLSSAQFPPPTMVVNRRRYWSEDTLVEWEKTFVPHGESEVA